MPFGERLGSMRPRCSYMRSVCGVHVGELGGVRVDGYGSPSTWKARISPRIRAGRYPVNSV